MRNTKRGKLQPEVIRLYRKKNTIKEIAKKVGITVKTASAWLKDFKDKEASFLSKIEALDNKLDLMLKRPNTPPLDIKNITDSIAALENRLGKFLKS